MAAGQARKKVILGTLVAAALAAGGWSIAADMAEGGKSDMQMHGGHGMGGMRGMEGMMGSCDRMMHGGSTVPDMPQLPPGNAKLQLQMQAEMMQKMAETLAKYAARIDENKK